VLSGSARVALAESTLTDKEYWRLLLSEFVNCWDRKVLLVGLGVNVVAK
jgi:hypothetical protein